MELSAETRKSNKFFPRLATLMVVICCLFVFITPLKTFASTLITWQEAQDMIDDGQDLSGYSVDFYGYPGYDFHTCMPNYETYNYGHSGPEGGHGCLPLGYPLHWQGENYIYWQTYGQTEGYNRVYYYRSLDHFSNIGFDGDPHLASVCNSGNRKPYNSSTHSKYVFFEGEGRRGRGILWRPNCSEPPEITSFTGIGGTLDPNAGGSITFNFTVDPSSYNSASITINGQDIGGTSWNGILNGKVVSPGSYTATLTVTEGEQAATASTPVTVTGYAGCQLMVHVGSSANVGGGELSDSLTLFSVGGTPGFDLDLRYRSQDSYAGPLGVGWHHSYDIQLSENNFDEVVLKKKDGRYFLYRPLGGGSYRSQSGDYSVLAKSEDGWIRTLKNGRVQRFDGTGRIVESVDRNGNAQTFAYADGLLASVSDGAGRSVAFTYDGAGNLVSIDDPAGNSYGIAVTDTLSSITLPDGGAWNYDYQGNAFLAAKTDPLGNTTSYAYDERFRVVESVDQQGQVRTIAYPASSEAVRTTTFTEKDGSVWQYTYDTSAGDLLSKTDPQGGITSYNYDANHNMLSKTEPGVGTISYTYDGTGNMTSVIDPAGQTTDYTYNEYGQVLSITEDDGTDTKYVYDEKGNLTQVASPDGSINSFGYDEAGRLISTSGPTGTTSLGYDDAGNLKSVTGPDGGTTVYGYDAAGNRTSVTDAEGNITRFEYDARGRVNKVIDAAGKITEFGYDAAGNRTKVVDANRNVTRYEYNAQGQVVKMIDALGNETAFEYSGSAGCSTCSGGVDQLTALTDAKGQTTRFGYDVLGRLTKEIDPLGHETLYGYDAAGRVASKTDPNGNTIDYSYDGAGRLTAKGYPDGTSTTFSYDTGGRLEIAANQHISYTFGYDAAGRVTSVSDSRGYTLGYTYDAAGRRQSVSGPFGMNNTYSYDEAGRLESIVSPAGKFTFGYDALGRRSTLSFPNGVETSYAYDDLGRLTELITASGPQIVAQNLYTHDAVGNRLSNQDARTTKSYDYDAIYRLTETVASMPGFSADKKNGKSGKGVANAVDNQKEFYQYDPVGNRVTTSEHKSYAHNLGNELLSADGTRYTYDANGNRTQKIDTDGTTVYAWNAENQLISVDLPSGTRVTFAYDPFGRRIAKSVADFEGRKTTLFVYDGEDVFAEVDGGGSVGNRYVHGPDIDEPLALVTKKDTVFYHADGLGSVVAMTDGKAKTVQDYAYASYGNLHDMKNRIKQPYAYTAREYDRETGLYYYRARYYDAEVGGFISEDPIGFFSDDNNLYNYVRNNPVIYSDPLGNMSRRPGQSPTGANPLGSLFWPPEVVPCDTLGYCAEEYRKKKNACLYTPNAWCLEQAREWMQQCSRWAIDANCDGN